MSSAKVVKEAVKATQTLPDSFEVDCQTVEMESVCCNFCGSKEFTTEYAAPDVRFGFTDHQFPVVTCSNCGLSYLSPRPTFETIGAFYPSRYFKGRDAAKQEKRYAAEVALLPVKEGKLLDVGCAQGDFVVYAQRQGFDADGLEVAGNAENPHGVTIHRGFDAIADETYDIVTSWAVFEHLHDPMSYFKEVSRILKPGGHFAWLVPNFASFRSRVMRHEDIPRHIYFYTPDTARAYCGKFNLEVEDILQEDSVYYGGHRKFFNYWGLKLIGRHYGPQHREKFKQHFREGKVPLLEHLYLFPWEHLDRLLHKKVSKWFAKRGQNGTMVVRARKAS